MLKKFLMSIKKLIPEYESVCEIVSLSFQEHKADYIVVYRVRGKSNVNKLWLTQLLQDNAMLNALSGEAVRDLTACYLELKDKLDAKISLVGEKRTNCVVTDMLEIIEEGESRMVCLQAFIRDKKRLLCATYTDHLITPLRQIY